MDANKLEVGQRLVSNSVIDIHPLGMWPVGTCGTVTEIERIDGQIVAHVKLDTHYDCLAEWGNCLIAWETGDEVNGDTTLAAFNLA